MGLLFVVLIFSIVLLILSLLSVGWGLLMGLIFPSMTTGEAIISGTILISFTIVIMLYVFYSLKKFQSQEAIEEEEADSITIFPNLKRKYTRKPRRK